MFKNIDKDYTGITGLNDELQSLYINYIYENNDNSVLVIVNSIYEANRLYETLYNYNHNVQLFLMDDFIPSEAEITSPEFEVNRLETLNNLVIKSGKKIVITNLNGMLRFLPKKEVWKTFVLNLSKNMDINKDELYRTLCNMGYKTETLVTKTGEISNRGYILDLFPINSNDAIRIEFWGDTIDSIRLFDVDTQLSLKELDNVLISPFSEFLVLSDVPEERKKQKYLHEYTEVSNICEYLGNPILIYKDYSQIYNSYLILEEDIHNYNVSNNICEKFMWNLEDFSNNKSIYIMSVDNILPNIKLDDIQKYNGIDAPKFDDNVNLLNETLSKYLNSNKKVTIYLKSKHQIDNFVKCLLCPYIITDIDNLTDNKVNLVVGKINNGYIIDDNVVLSEKNLFKNIEVKSSFRSKFKYSTKISNIDSLNIGDYVVHNTHGIGIYQGIVALKKGNIVKDYLQVMYSDNGKLYIPVEKIELISKYSNNDDLVPKINKLGGSDWQKTKMRVSERLQNIAGELLKVAAERKLKVGFPFKKDTPEQIVFENEFEYNETSDQLKSIKVIKKLMEEPSPMDILLCGDVGYGKTEVAFRAIFKALCSNKQVAYLCPTTILSSQQYNSALARFKSFPVNIALLNRFTTKKEQTETLKKLKEGNIDILFGTHRILSDDVEFKDLGLLVVDEEQRFGVTHKEKIKKYKCNVDVLTLSATPIPRTLQMSLVGIRDLSLIETPPVNRYPVQTYVLEENDYVIKDAIYKELSRNGQVFILCNRIENFESRKNMISKLVPEAKINYAHGKMNKNEIEDVMISFVNKEFDVLLCTTIIETGIDIPNANTLIILDADKFGLSQLYQIRGRVGRTDRVAYAYLMYGKHKVLTQIASKRLSAIKEFASLGSGFKIAMRDLSIRGAGDVLGVEQSGFIDAIGIELYLKMLNAEVNKLKGIETVEEVDELPSLNIETHIDNSYVSDDELKIEIHKLINQINSYDKLIEIKNILEDRFGKISESMLIYMYEELFENLKNKKGIENVKQDDRFIKLIFSLEKTNSLSLDELFIDAFRITRNFKFSYENERLVITLNITNLEKHWIYYILDIFDCI